MIFSSSNHSDERRTWDLPLKDKLHFLFLWPCPDAFSHGDCRNSSCCWNWISLGFGTNDRVDVERNIINSCGYLNASNDLKWTRKTERDSLSHHHSWNFWRHSCPDYIWDSIHNLNQQYFNRKDINWKEYFCKFLSISFRNWNRTIFRILWLVILNF